MKNDPYKNIKLKDFKYIDIDKAKETPNVIHRFVKWYMVDISSAIAIILLLIVMIKLIAERYN